MKFRTLLIDPPWEYENTAVNGAAAKNYRTLTAEDLCALRVSEIASPDAVLLLWCTWPQLPIGLRVVEAWGFTYKTGFPWIKMLQAGVPRIGTGYHTRSVSEFILIGTRGKQSPPPIASRQPGVIFHPTGRHSAKPEQQYAFAEAYPGPYLEIFSRPQDGLFPPRPGWVQIGNDATGRDIREDIRLLIGEYTEAEAH